MSRLDTEEIPASGSGETLRFLFSGCSVAIAIVCVKAIRDWRVLGTTKLAELVSVSTPICSLGPGHRH